MLAQGLHVLLSTACLVHSEKPGRKHGGGGDRLRLALRRSLTSSGMVSFSSVNIESLSISDMTSFSWATTETGDARCL